MASYLFLLGAYMAEHVTMKDVADAAGVSLGTVSNVLKGNRNVSLATVQRVQTAIRETGYRAIIPTRNHTKTRKTRLVGVILPSVVDPNFAQFFSGVDHRLGERGFTAILCVTSEIQAREQRAIEQLVKQNVDGMIIVTCQPESAEMFQSLVDNGIPLVFAERRPAGGRFPLVEYDCAAGLEGLTRRLLEGGMRRPLLVTGPLENSSERASADGFLRALAAGGFPANPEQWVVETNFNKESAFSSVVVRLNGQPVPDAIITTSGLLAAGSQKAVRLLAPEENPKFITLGESSWAPTDLAGAAVVLRRDAKGLGQAAADLLLERVENNPAVTPRRQVLLDITQPGEAPAAPPPSRRIKPGAKPIRALLLAGASCSALELLLPSFEKSAGHRVEITRKSILEIGEILRDPSARAGFDILQIDQPWLGEVAAEGLLLELDAWLEEKRKNAGDWLPGVLDAYCRYNGHYYAVPYLFGAQLLFYRKDYFNDPYLRSSFRKQHRYDLRAPRTWEEFNHIGKFFTRRFNPESPLKYGLTLGAQFPNAAVCEFLPRLMAFADLPFEADSMLRLLASPAAEAALRNYVDSYQYAAPGSEKHWWDEQVRLFSRGEAAMMILFLGHVAELSDRRKSKIVGRIGYDIIPGGMPLLGGWTLGVNRHSRKLDAAREFVSWFSANELMIPFTILGGAPPSRLVYDSPEVSSLYPWLPTAVESFSLSQWRSVSKVTTAGKIEERVFEEILGGAVHAAVCGRATPAEALKHAGEELSRLVGSP